MDGRRIFVNAGALMDSKTPNEIIGVLAHETGHIAGGHLSQLRQQLAEAQTQSIIAHAARRRRESRRSRGGNAGNPAAAILGPQEMIRRSLLSYRARAGGAGRPRRREVPRRHRPVGARACTTPSSACRDQILFAARNADPYMQSHPMPAERVRALEEIAKHEPELGQEGSAGAAAAPRPDARQALRLPGARPTRSRAAIRSATRACRRATPARLRPIGMPTCAPPSRQIDALIQTQPNNPYFHELKGQALLEGGKPAEAIAPLQRAIQLAPHPALIQVLLAQALNATNSPKSADEAVALLRDRARARAGIGRRLSPSSRWPMAARATSPRPISPPPRPRSCAATARPRASSRRAPRPASRSARPAG